MVWCILKNLSSFFPLLLSLVGTYIIEESQATFFFSISTFLEFQHGGHWLLGQSHTSNIECRVMKICMMINMYKYTTSLSFLNGKEQDANDTVILSDFRFLQCWRVMLWSSRLWHYMQPHHCMVYNPEDYNINSVILFLMIIDLS